MNNQKEQKTKDGILRKDIDERNDVDVAAAGAAFRRSSLLQRSPPTNRTPVSGGTAQLSSGAAGRTGTPIGGSRRTEPGSTKLPDNRSADRRISSDVATACATGVDEIPPNRDLSDSLTEGSPRLELIRRMRNLEETAISQCREELRSMQQATMRQKNISIDVKAGIAKIGELLEVITSYRRTWKAAEGERLLSDHRSKTITQQVVDIPTPKTANPKRVATSPAAPDSSKKAKGDKHIAGGLSTIKVPETDRNATSERRSQGWQTVSRKNRKKKQSKKSEEKAGKKPAGLSRAKPEAVMVKPAEGKTYSQVLKDLRSKMSANESARIRSVRKTAGGAILLELAKGDRIQPEFIEQVKSTVRETASVSGLRPTATIEIRDLDSLTSKEEVETAIRGLLPGTEEQIHTRVTAPNPRDQVRAFVTLSTEGAARLLKAGEVRIGWILAKIRAVEDIRRCYRCLGVGHTQAKCSGPDRKNVCIRCGEPGHRMKDCRSAPKCINCAEAKRSRTDHLIGSRSCPLFRKC